MKLQRFALLTALVGVVSLFACVTINVYFPEAAVKELAVQIEDAVQQRAAEQAPAPPAAPAPPSEEKEVSVDRSFSAVSRTLIADLLAQTLGASPVYAEQDDVAPPAISNPAIRTIIDSRAKRAPEIRKFKNQGVLGESNQALVDIRDLNSLGLQDRAAVQKLVKAENADRETMFKEIAAATGVDLSQLPQIRETYAVTLRDKAQRGDWIQDPNGQWKQKD